MSDTLTRRPIVVTSADRPPALNVVGEQITVLASADHTGSYEIFVQTGPEGSGPPPHSHPWDEAFYVLGGAIEFWVGDRMSSAGPGTLVHVPGGTTHHFRFGRDGGEMVSMTSRRGASALFTDIDRQIAPDAPDLATLVAIATAHELTIPPPVEP